jgi:hypothetical protein
MSSTDTLHGFAFGEDLDGVSRRSLGFRLLAPAAPAAWSAEVEALAHWLQATPYPEHWPPADLFCSVLLSNGERLIATARYGLADHTPSKRRGGLELVGVVGPRGLDPSKALMVYSWLRRQRAQAEDLRQLGEQHGLGKVLTEPLDSGGPHQAAALPVRAWQAGTLLFSASSATAPDDALGLLSQVTTADWQWLPLCGPDFPLESYSERGPLVAWTPHLIDVAVRLGAPTPPRPVATSWKRWAVLVPALVLALLLGGNLWALLALPSRIERARPAEPKEKGAGTSVHTSPQRGAENESRQKLALALHHLLQQQASVELAQAESSLLAGYERLAAGDPGLRVDGKQAQAAIGLVYVLAGRSADRVARLIEQEFKDKKGYDPDFIRLIGQRVRERLLAEASRSPP